VKLVTYEHEGKRNIGTVVEERIVPLSGIAPDMLSLIEMGSAGLDRAREAVKKAQSYVPLAEVSLLAPLPSPRRNIMCLGLNYVEHAQESAAAIGEQAQLPEFPVIFTKATLSVNGPYSDIPFDAAVSEKIDWEAELGVVIGKMGKNIQADGAMDYVFGYLVINDVSARDLQRQHRQFFKGKSLDGCCPMGPWIVTADEVPDPHNLVIQTLVNGILKQDSNTRYMIFDIPATITHLSNGMTLLPGDILATWTPSGVAFARQPVEFLKPGDEVECRIEGIGSIRNRLATG